MSTVKTNNAQIGQSATATNNFTWYQPASPDGTVRLGVGNSGATSADVMTLNSSGNVGIGITSPAAALHVASGNLRLTNGAAFATADSLIREINSAAGSANQYVTSSIGFRTGNFSDAGVITFSTANNASTPTERMRLDQVGNLGLGAAPSAQITYPLLQVGGQLGMWSAPGSNNFIYSNSYFGSGSANKYIANGYAHRIIFSSNGGAMTFDGSDSGTAGASLTYTTLMTVAKGTTLALQGASSASGTGITFPATQSPSSDANTLDDYEEGTFTAYYAGTDGTTPMFVSGTHGNPYALRYSGANARYVKVGRQVYWSAYIYMDDSFAYNSGFSGSTNLFVSGLPFQEAGSTGITGIGGVYPAVYIGYYSAWSWTAAYTPMGYTQANTTYCLIGFASASNFVQMGGNAVGNANTGLILSGVYTTTN